jgi:hypothetical protein
MASIWGNLEKKYLKHNKISVKQSSKNRIPTSEYIFHVHNAMNVAHKGISGDS